LEADSVDTVLLFEVLEHVPDYEFVLQEARRVARKNVLVTVPNCGDAQRLFRASLIADHMLELDHVNFFTREAIEESLGSIFRAHDVREEEYKDTAFFQLVLPRFFALGLSALARSQLLRRRFSYRIFAEALV
jgi:ubiquinone/menaquinone biosynthesis C-methylase UbiE